jgi:hypothetical protein
MERIVSKKNKWKIIKEKKLKPKYSALKGGTYGPASCVRVYSQEGCEAWAAENQAWISENLKKMKKKPIKASK